MKDVTSAWTQRPALGFGSGDWGGRSGGIVIGTIAFVAARKRGRILRIRQRILACGLYRVGLLGDHHQADHSQQGQSTKDHYDKLFPGDRHFGCTMQDRYARYAGGCTPGHVTGLRIAMQNPHVNGCV